jgi:hypothetical protein
MNPKGAKWVISPNKWFQKVYSELSPITNESKRYKVSYPPFFKWIQKVQSELSPLKQMNPKGAKWVNGSKRYNVSYLP